MTDPARVVQIDTLIHEAYTEMCVTVIGRHPT